MNSVDRAMKETGEPISAGRVPVDDIEMYFEVHGQGEPLLMIMGLGGPLARLGVDSAPEIGRKLQGDSL
ncbi:MULTISPECIES: hypothetical protein [Methanothrix]|uniref:hypothetical protein n=1 Tax=Methanothrix TaxID=2222 RepID=UPI00064F6C4A|nr:MULTISPECIES: hypothetical protein [Methanothrix]